MRRIRLPLAVGLVTVVSLAHAERTETPPQLFKSGDTVNMPTIGATVTLPQAPAGWALSVGMETNSNYDILRRQDPTNPALQVDFNRPKSPDCPAIAKSFDKLISAGLKLKRWDPSPFSPASFERWGYELPFYDGKSTLKVCTNTATGPVLADIQFQGSLGSLDATWVMPLLDEVGRAVNGHRSTEGGGGFGGTSTASGDTVNLPLTGLPAIIPSGFTYRVFTGSAGRQSDLIERSSPPRLSIMVNRRDGYCSLNASSPGAHFVYDPPYLPAGWSSKVVEIDSNDGNNIAVMCVNKGGGQYILASVGYYGSLTHPDVMVTRTVLSPMLGESGGGSSSGGGFKDTGGGGSSYTPSDEKATAKVALEFMYAFSTPKDGVDFENSSGFGLGLDAFSRSKEGPIGGAVELAVNGAIGSKGFLPWDARFGVGPALIVSSLTVAPLIGIGGDGVNAAMDANVLKVDSGVYYYYGGRMLVSFTPGFGIGGFFTIHKRSPDDWKKETRFGGSLVFKGWSLGFRSTTYENESAKAAVNSFVGAILF